MQNEIGKEFSQNVVSGNNGNKSSLEENTGLAIHQAIQVGGNEGRWRRKFRDYLEPCHGHSISVALHSYPKDSLSSRLFRFTKPVLNSNS